MDIHIIIETVLYPMQTDWDTHIQMASAAAGWVVATKRGQINVQHSRSLSAVV